MPKKATQTKQQKARLKRAREERRKANIGRTEEGSEKRLKARRKRAGGKKDTTGSKLVEVSPGHFKRVESPHMRELIEGDRKARDKADYQQYRGFLNRFGYTEGNAIK